MMPPPIQSTFVIPLLLTVVARVARRLPPVAPRRFIRWRRCGMNKRQSLKGWPNRFNDSTITNQRTMND
jgi:hypothetical protein